MYINLIETKLRVEEFSSGSVKAGNIQREVMLGHHEGLSSWLGTAGMFSPLLTSVLSEVLNVGFQLP